VTATNYVVKLHRTEKGPQRGFLGGKKKKASTSSTTDLTHPRVGGKKLNKEQAGAKKDEGSGDSRRGIGRKNPQNWEGKREKKGRSKP